MSREMGSTTTGGSTGPLTPDEKAELTAPLRTRNPWLVLGLTVITIGIYWFAWYFLINRELRDYGRRQGDEWLAKGQPGQSLAAVTLGALILIPMVVSMVNTVRRVRRAEELNNVKKSNGWIVGGVALGSWVLLFAPLLFIPSYLQQGLNQAWARQPNSEPAPGPKEWIAALKIRFGGEAPDPAEAAVNQAITDLTIRRKDYEQRIKDRVKALTQTKKSGAKSVKEAERNLKTARTIPLIAHAGKIRVYEDHVETPEGSHPLEDQVKATVDSAGNMMVTRRHTLTRFALIGVFSVFTPKATKHDNRELYFLIEHPEWASIAKLNPDGGMGARQAAQATNLAARRAATAKVERQATIERATTALDEAQGAARSAEQEKEAALRSEHETYPAVVQLMEVVDQRLAECETPSKRIIKSVEKARHSLVRANPFPETAGQAPALGSSQEAT
jgi:hypothetical protein